MRTETEERFLREITNRLPVERIVELHLFPSFRQGQMETGCAVIAAVMQVVPEPGAALDHAPDATADVAAGEADAEDEAECAAVGNTVGNTIESTDGDADAPASEDTDVRPVPPPPRRARQTRHTVFTARYRLTRKGVDRGRWEFDIVEEADAPLLTVDAVVRGVQERAGEETEPERLTGDAVRDSLPELKCTATT